VRSFYGAGVEAFTGLGGLYIRTLTNSRATSSVSTSTDGWPCISRWSTMTLDSSRGSRYVSLAWKVYVDLMVLRSQRTL
jgi:hypothetical protein